MLGDVRQRLRHHVVGGLLDRLRQPTVDPYGEVNPGTGPAGERHERRTEPTLGEDRRVNPAGELAQLIHHVGQLGGQLTQPRGERACVRRPC